jgi:trigger factor
MNISSKPTGPHILEVTIELGEGELREARSRVLARAAQGMKIEGFRPGKAPVGEVEKNLDPQALEAESLQDAIEESFGKAAQEEKWDVRSAGQVKVLSQSPTTATFSVQVNLWPSCELPDLSSISVSSQKVEVSDKEVADALDTMANMRATFLDKTGTVASGDRVEIDIDATMNGVSLESGKARGMALVVGGASFIPGFEERLVGLVCDMPSTFDLAMPADYYESTLAGNVVTFTVTVRKIQAVLKPAIDDTFAASAGAFTTLVELEAAVRDRLSHEKADRERSRVRTALLDAIIDKATIEVPDDMRDAELEAMTNRFRHDLGSRGMDMAMYLASIKKTEEELKVQWRPQAVRQVKAGIVLRTLQRDNHIHIEPPELEEAVSALMAQSMAQGREMPENMDPDTLRQYVYERLATERTLMTLEKLCGTAKA